MSAPAAPRRSQVERTAATVARLTDATIATIIEVGYHRATVRRICTRAGVSQGGLFAHFRTRRDLIVSALGRLLESQLATLRQGLSGAPPGEVGARLSSVIGSVETLAWLDVLAAARTDKELLDAVRPLVATREAFLRRLIAEHHPTFASLSPTSQRVWLEIADREFQAQALGWHARAVDASDPVLLMLDQLLELLAATERRRRTGAGSGMAGPGTRHISPTRAPDWPRGAGGTTPRPRS